MMTQVLSIQRLLLGQVTLPHQRFFLRADDWLWSCLIECDEDSSVEAADGSFWGISILGRPR
jgi:hypothetical protein